MERNSNDEKKYMALFETTRAKSKSLLLYKLFAATIFFGICSVWTYRVTHLLDKQRSSSSSSLIWVGALAAEIWFGLYWVFTQAGRWNPVYRSTHKDRLPTTGLPGVDVFVCTADHTIEPPLLVVNTVLSVMAYDYPPDKLTVYLSDDGASQFTLYALLEASRFATSWVPFCKRFEVKPRSPDAFFAAAVAVALVDESKYGGWAEELLVVKKLYEEMKDRIEIATEVGKIPEEDKSLFSEWESNASSSSSSSSSWKRDHPTILQILIDGRDSFNNGSSCGLPTLVYLAREKRPTYHHNFKAGAMNALIRVSSLISNAPILLNLDCDMYSNDPSTLKDALCFFMDEDKNHDIAYLQFPQMFDNVSKNDIYGSSLLVIYNVEFTGMDGFGGPMYVGSGAFHRRDTLCGRDFHPNDSKLNWRNYGRDERIQTLSVQQLVEEATSLADCASEDNSQWGKQMGLKYGCPVEDVITGLSIQRKGWRSVYYNPKREAFLGKAPTTLPQSLVQHKRWSEGDFQILLSKYSPVWYSNGNIKLGLQMAYLCYCLWAPNCLAVLYYSIFPSLCLLKGIPLFPAASTPWFLPFGYLIFANYLYSLVEFLKCGGTSLGWWNEQRTWLYKRTCSYLFAFVDTILQIAGFGESGFVITAKVADDDVVQRYRKELMEFGYSSAMFNILATVGMLNLLCFVGVVKGILVVGLDENIRVFDEMGLQILICAVLVIINWPLYQALFFRIDKGRMPVAVTVSAFVFSFVACISFVLFY